MSYIPYSPPSTSQFDEALVAEATHIINLKSIYGVTDLRDVTEVAGSGTVTNNNIEYKLTTTANGADTATLDSAERGRYLAGQDAVAGIGARVSDTPTGLQDAKWGYFDDDNGFGFGVDATGVYVFRRSGGSDTKTYQASWNADTMDGNGNSGLTLALVDGNIFHVTFSWYGYGTVEFSVITADANNAQKEVVVHRTKVTGSVSIENPNLPIRAAVTNGGTASVFDSLYIGGRQFSTRGTYTPSRRVTGQPRLLLGSITSGAFLPLVTFRRKTGIYQAVSIKTQGFDITTDQSLIIQIRSNASLTSASYATPSDYTATETALEVDIAATAVTGGDVLWTGLVGTNGTGPSASGSATIPLTDVDLINSHPITICAKAVSTTATASCALRMVEEW